MDLTLIKFFLDFAKDSGLLPVMLFSLLLKVYVINGNVDRHFKALQRERRLLRLVIRRVDRLVEIRESEIKEPEGREENAS